MENQVRKNLLRVAVLALFATPAGAETLHVRVFDSEQQPVPGVAVFVEQAGAHRTIRTPKPAVMDQRERRFDPHVLVVQKGAAVDFPNSDVVAHHVYSFSKPNNFVLPLYKGSPPGPVRFNHDGVVILGCNIHDSMLGYIVVVDTDVYAMTNADGVAQLEVDADAASWEVYAWSPRIRDSRDPLVKTIGSGQLPTATFVLEKKLRPAHVDHSESVPWNDYD